MPLKVDGPGGSSLHEVRGPDSPLLEPAFALFRSLFPEDKRYLAYIEACTHGRHPSHPHTYDHVWLVRQGERWVGMRVFSYITTRDFGHGAYIGFLPDCRGQGLGSWLVEQTLAQLEDDARTFGRGPVTGYLVEVERPLDAATVQERRQREKRLQFHRRCGGIVLPVPFLEPVMIQGVSYIAAGQLNGEQPRPMHLVLVPSQYGKGLAHLDLADFLSGIYYDVYRLPRGHESLARSLAFLYNGAQP
jgi:GNAT superfamily N-acetyltransferase